MKIIIQRILLIPFLTLFPIVISAQDTDSLKKVLAETAIDTIYINTALDIAWSYMYTNSDSAEIYGNKALQSAMENGRMLKVASAYNTLGVVYIVKAEYYEALSFLSKALETGTKLLESDSTNYSYKRRVMAIHTNMGNIYYFKGKYDQSIASYIVALKLAEEIGFRDGVAICSSNLGSAYKDLYNYPKALEYNYKALEIATETGDSFSLSQSLNNLGSVYFSVPDYDSAHYYFLCSISINEASKDEYELINNYMNLGDVLRDIGKYDSALYYYEKSLTYSEKLNSVEGLINCNFMIAQLYQRKEQRELAISYFNKSLSLAKESGTMRFVMMNNEQLSEIYRDLKDYKKAYSYFVDGSIIRDSIFNAESDERIADMEAKYATEKKEEEIVHLTETAELERIKSVTNKFVFIGIIIILVLVIVLIIISYRNYKLKQFSERQLIQQKTEREILDAVIDTENKERKRFAEDLHDGLGVLLSTLRLYINEIDGSLSAKEMKEIIGQSNSILDDAIENTRSISNNIMPAALKTSGLEAAIRSHGDKINSSGNIKVDIKSVNFSKHHKSSIEISLYRIITEMINNSLKHSKAGNINIILTEKNQRIFITYTDDGIGFDYEKVRSSKQGGMGLDNMISRIQSIGGSCSIESSEGKGFHAALELGYY